MRLKKEDIYAISKRAKESIVEGIVEHQDEIFKADITPGDRLNMFLAQLAHESDGFKTTREYASGAAYEGRSDLGNTEEGDGRRFRGRGLIQLTGRANYEEFNRELPADIDIVANPELVEEFPLALTAATFFWTKRKLNNLADQGDFRAVTRRINGGYNGLGSRLIYLSNVEELELGGEDESH